MGESPTNRGDKYIMNHIGDLVVEITHIYGLMVKLKILLPVGNMPLTNDKKVPILAQIKKFIQKQAIFYQNIMIVSLIILLLNHLKK
jgi:hypothetical protein